MRKYSKIIAPLLALMLAFALAGCGEDAAATSGLGDKGWEKNVLQITTVTNWAGLDFTNAVLEFAEDDTVYIKGRAIDDVQVYFSAEHSGWSPAGGGWNQNVAGGADFEKTITLTAADASNIAGTTPPNLRLKTNKANASMVVIELTIKDADGKVKLDLSADLQKLKKGPVDFEKDKIAGVANCGLDQTPPAVAYEILGPK